MSNDTRVNNIVQISKIPDSVSPELRLYLEDLEKILRQSLSGDVNVLANLLVGGEIYVPNGDGEIVPLTDAGILGN